MPISEAARHDLYNGLTELLGLDRADTLMAYLPEFDPEDVATKSDIAGLRVDTKADIARLDSGITALDLELKEFRAEMANGFADVNNRFDRVNDRFDRMFLTLVAGLFVVVAAMAGFVFTTL